MVVDKLKSMMLEYMRSKDTLHLGVIRYFLSLVKYKEIDLRPQHVELTDDHVAKLLKKQISNRLEAIDIAQKGGRQDVVEKEKAELSVLSEFKALFPDYEF